MWCHLMFLVFSLQAVPIQAAFSSHDFAIKWVQSEATGLAKPPIFALESQGSAGHIRGLVPPSKLMLRELPDSGSPETIPQFTVKLDGSIVWGATGGCISAADAERVYVDRCNGGPAQKWNWLPNGLGRTRIQLANTNRCLVADTEGGSVGTPAVLRDCHHWMAESWKLEEPVALPTQSTAYQFRYLLISLVALVVVGASSLGAWFWQARIKSTVPLAAEQAGVTMAASGRCGDVRMVQLSSSSPPWELPEFEDLLKEAAKEAMPFREAETELTEALVKVKTVEDVDAAIEKCLESGGRDLSDAVLAAVKIRKGAKEDGSVTPAKPPKKKAGGKSVDPWARKLAKTHDNAR